VGIHSVMAKSWFIVRLLIVCASLQAFSPSAPGFLGLTVATAGDLSCPAVQNACGCSTCSCGGSQKPSCPSGQVLYDDYCVPACPQGFIRYPGMPGLCMPPCHHGCPEGYDQIPLPECPQGFHRDIRNPDICLQDPGVRDYQGQCPVGMSYAPETGRCEVECPQGTFRNDQALCESYYSRQCPDGYGRDPDSGKCLPPGTWPTGYKWICLPQCPAGTVRDIEKPTRCIPQRPECPQGYDNIQGRCLPVCEPGTIRDNYGYCVPPQSCPDGSYLNIRGQCVENQCPEGFEDVRGQCVPPCEQGWTRDRSGQCTPPEQGCEEGEELIRGQCVPVCEQGLTRNRAGECTPPERGCDQGQELFGGQCVPVCKQGLKRNDDGRCVPPPPRCREGQVFNPQTGQCERKRVCPENTRYNPNRNRCEPVQQPCDQGEVRDRNGRCVPVSNDPDCRRGEVLRNGKCVPVNVDPICRKGEILRGGQCVPIRVVPQGCPDGFILDRKTGRCFQPRDDEPQRPIINELLKPGVIQKLIPRGQAEGGQTPNRTNNACPEGTFLDSNGRCQKVQ
jgi:hypothetical protein